MEELLKLAPLADSRHYRELASKHRNIASQCQSPGARQRILDLVSWYEGRANHLDTGGAAVRSGLDPNELRSPGSRCRR
jgi:hypothetical protein